jgi:membrane fusion protein
MKKAPKTESGNDAFNMQSPVLLAQPLLERVLAIFFSAIFIAAILFATFTQYSRTQPARGEIAAASGFSTVVAEDSGVVARLFVKPGERVAKGTPLVYVSRPQTVGESGDTISISLARMSEALVNLDMQIAESQRAIDATRRQIATVRNGSGVSITAARARRALTEQRQEVAAGRQVALEELATEGVITSMAVDRARVDTLQLMQEAAEADFRINEIARGRDERVAMLEAQIHDLSQNALSLHSQKLKTEKDISDLQARQAFTIVAPDDGVVAAVPIRPGQRIEAGQRLLAIAKPSARLTAVLEVPSRAVGLIEEGQRVSLKYDAFPYQTFGLRYGRVTRVETVSIEGGQPMPEAEEPRDRHFLVEVAPEDTVVMAYGRPRQLKVGMTLTADIEVERRSLLSWWLSPLLTLKGRLQ